MYDKGPLQEGKESRSNLISYNGATGWPYGKKEQEKVEWNKLRKAGRKKERREEGKEEWKEETTTFITSKWYDILNI